VSAGAVGRADGLPENAGVEWVVDAFGCTAESTGSIDTLGQLIDRLVRDLDLHPVAPPLWRTFDGGGVTGLLLLSESHFTCHSFPEMGFVAFNLYCCRQRSGWSWEAQLAELFGATRVVVRELVRG
jgi:S-adenosylmethionine decarboxylase